MVPRLIIEPRFRNVADMRALMLTQSMMHTTYTILMSVRPRTYMNNSHHDIIKIRNLLFSKYGYEYTA